MYLKINRKDSEDSVGVCMRGGGGRGAEGGRVRRGSRRRAGRRRRSRGGGAGGAGGGRGGVGQVTPGPTCEWLASAGGAFSPFHRNSSDRCTALSHNLCLGSNDKWHSVEYCIIY